MKQQFIGEVAERKDKEKFAEEIVAMVNAEFERRQKERYDLERQWELNLKFLSGNQYSEIDRRGEIFETDKTYSWQNREVYNHIAPIIESRLAKFNRVVPVLGVRPLTGDEDDVKNSTLAERLIKESLRRVDIEDVVRGVTAWSEVCGTGFYKIVWNNDGGKLLGETDGNPVYEGDIKIIPVSPFEIFPDSIYTEKLCDVKSLIHARVMTADAVLEKYGKKVVGENVGVFDLSPQSALNKKVSAEKNDIPNACVVKEYYELPNKLWPKGRLISVCGEDLLYYGDLPYQNGTNGGYSYPFVKQESTATSGSFFGTSVIERLIPIQRAYNAVKNRKHEFLNRLSTGVMTVEDGSIDVDDLATDGLSPGKVLVYRQGSTPPSMMGAGTLPDDFRDEEEKLMNEFVAISGLSDVTSSKQNSNLKSGSALELLVSQDNERMTVIAERIRRCYVEISRQVLKLYAQFITGVKAVNYQDAFKKTKVCYADKDTAKSDDVYLVSENELAYTEKNKKELLIKLYESGILFDENGVIPSRTKDKVLSLLGYSELDGKCKIYALHEEKAQEENQKLLKTTLLPDLFDDHKIHVEEHTRYVLTEYADMDESSKNNFALHIKEHEKALSIRDTEIKN